MLKNIIKTLWRNKAMNKPFALIDAAKGAGEVVRQNV